VEDFSKQAAEAKAKKEEEGKAQGLFDAEALNSKLSELK